MLGEGSELLALERLCVAGAGILDDDSLVLNVGDAEALGRQRCNQCGVRGKLLTTVTERAPT